MIARVISSVWQIKFTWSICGERRRSCHRGLRLTQSVSNWSIVVSSAVSNSLATTPGQPPIASMKQDAFAFNFSGKVGLVTGGSRGIGRATAQLFARSGAKVVIGDIDPAGSETVDEIKREGGKAIFVKTDVSNESDVKNLIATAVKTYGGLHCAFNNAGVLPPTVRLVEMDESTFDKTSAVDLKGVFLCMKHEIAHMLQSGGGAIVNSASIAGLIAEPGISAYVAAKHDRDDRRICGR